MYPKNILVDSQIQTKMEPFLFRFKKRCSTAFDNEEKFYYDNSLDMVFVKESKNNIPVIHDPNGNVPGTKKADLEKGEDSKDSIM